MELTSHISFLPIIFPITEYSIHVNWYAIKLFKDSILNLLYKFEFFITIDFQMFFLQLNFFQPVY